MSLVSQTTGFLFALCIIVLVSCEKPPEIHKGQMKEELHVSTVYYYDPDGNDEELRAVYESLMAQFQALSEILPSYEVTWKDTADSIGVSIAAQTIWMRDNQYLYQIQQQFNSDYRNWSKDTEFHVTCSHLLLCNGVVVRSCEPYAFWPGRYCLFSTVQDY